MAYYKIYNTGSGEISNIVEWNGTGSFEWPAGYDIALYTGSLTGSDQWTGSGNYGVSTQAGLFFGELTGAASGSFTGSLTGSFNNYSGSLGWIYDFPTGSFRTGSFTGSFTGSLEGTASYTTQALSASFATTASYVLGGGASVTSPGNDRLISSDGTSTGLIAESNLSFNGSLLNVTGSIQMSNPGEIRNPIIVAPDEKMTTLTVVGNNVGGIVTFNMNDGPVFKITLDGNVTQFTTSNDPPTGSAASFTLIAIGDGTARAAAWNPKFYWPGGAPALPSTLGNSSVFTFVTFDQGSAWLGLVVADDVAGNLG